MIFQYLGTAAAEGYPALFCGCTSCQEANQRGGRYIRTRSQAILDGRLLFDFCPDTYMHMLHHNVDLSYVSTCLVTHSHSDHLCPPEIEFRQDGYAYLPEDAPKTLYFYGSAQVGEAVGKFAPPIGEKQHACAMFRKVAPFETFEADGYTVTALPARHDPASGPYLYLVRRDGKALFYAHDTGELFDEVYDWFAEAKEREDLHIVFASLDCTAGAGKINYDSHCNLERDVEIRRRLIEIGVADEQSVFCLNHFSHNGNLNDNIAGYDELVPIALKAGFLVSYDGMKIEI